MAEGGQGCVCRTGRMVAGVVWWVGEYVADSQGGGGWRWAARSLWLQRPVGGPQLSAEAGATLVLCLPSVDSPRTGALCLRSSQKEAFLPVPRVAPDTAQQSSRQAPNLSGQTGPVSSPPGRSAPDLTGPWEPALSSCPRVDRKLRLGRLRPRFHGSDVCVRLSGAGCENGQSVRTKTDMKGPG